MLICTLDTDRMETSDGRTSIVHLLRAAMEEAQRKAILAATKHPVERARLYCAAVIFVSRFRFFRLHPKVCLWPPSRPGDLAKICPCRRGFAA